MAVRVRLALQVVKGSVPPAPLEVNAVVNSGYEAETPEAILPARLAARLGLWPRPPSGSTVETYGSPAGDFQITRIPAAAIASLPGTPAVSCDLVVSEAEREVLMSDALASALGIGIQDPKRGRWYLLSDPSQLRESEPAERWE